MKTDYRGALSKLSQAKGFWLLHGDEPLLSQHLLDQMHQHWNSQGIERQRIDLGSASDWREALGALDNLSLFASQLVVEVHGNHKPDPSTLKLLEAFAHDPAGNMLVAVMPKQDFAAQKTKFFQMVEANGMVVQLAVQNERDRQNILEDLAKRMGLQLHANAWRELLAQTQNNLLAAHQALMRLSSLHDDLTRPVTEQELKPALVQQSRFCTFDLGDAALLGQAEKVVQILAFLQETAEPTPLVLWTLTKEMKLVMQLLAHPNSEQQLGIWSNRQGLYRQACKRLRIADTEDWPDLWLRVDQSIKGVSDENPWDLLMQAALALAGVRLFV